MKRIAIHLLLTLALASSAVAQGTRFSVSYDAASHDGPVTGRVLLILAETADPEPRLQTGGDLAVGVPIFGMNVSNLAPGEAVEFDASVFGFPYRSLADLPPGDYVAQVVVNIYSEFRRADGHVLWMHDDRWEGQQPNRSPGNLFSEPVALHLHPGEDRTIELVADQVIGPVDMPEDTEWVRRFRIRSPVLSEFWGRDIHLGATVLLPAGYDDHPDVRYPVIYQQGHFSLRPPLGFREEGAFHDFWTGGDAPRMIGVTLQHPTPYYDDSYAVNSDNVGPYRDAIMQELIPEIERRFRVSREPWARALTGGSTGGWIALALQIFEPEAFGGTWSLCPDPVDFRYYELIDIYEDDNAFYREYRGIRTERPEARDTDGMPRYTVRNTSDYERVLGDRHRSGRQWAIWEAAYGPIGEDGYPKPLWDRETGEINHDVAQAWRKYDLRHILATNWPTLGPQLAGKLHVYTGDMDTYYLDNAVYLLEDFLEATTDPYYAGTIEYGRRQPHCWGPRGAELLGLIEEHLLENAPAGADTTSWRY